jgi:hypothetical protein
VNERRFYWLRPFLRVRRRLNARASMYVVDAARGLEKLITSPNSLVHLTTKVRPVVNDDLHVSGTMRISVTVQIVSDRNISSGIWRVAVITVLTLLVSVSSGENYKWRPWCLSTCPTLHIVSYCGNVTYMAVTALYWMCRAGRLLQL